MCKIENVAIFFWKQTFTVADLALWDGWDPAHLQLYIDYLDGKDVPEDAVIESESPYCLFRNITAPLENFQE